MKKLIKYILIIILVVIVVGVLWFLFNYDAIVAWLDNILWSGPYDRRMLNTMLEIE